jgi:subtilisin family serine protease
MSAHRKKKSNQRNERHGAAWGGGRGLLLAVVLLANLAYGQSFRPVLDDGGVVGQHSKLSRDLSDMLQSKSGAMRVIVQYKNAPGATQFSRAQGRGAKLHASLSSVRAGVFTMSPAAIRALANDSDVAFISPDRPLKAMVTSRLSGRRRQCMDSGYDGAGVGVAIIDSGVNDNHDDLRSAGAVSRLSITGISRVLQLLTTAARYGTLLVVALTWPNSRRQRKHVQR